MPKPIVKKKPQHPISKLQKQVKCDLCDSLTSVVYLWPQADLADSESELLSLVTAIGNKQTYRLCEDCNDEEETQTPSNDDSPLINQFFHAGDDDWEYSQYWESKKAALPSSPAAKPVGTPVPPKCNTPHNTEIDGPAPHYGKLHLVSERGGLWLAPNLDYAFGLSTGWDKITEPSAEFYFPEGKEGAIPDLSNVDVPPFAFLRWPDMQPPPRFIYNYVDWIAEKWSQGKNIQFGCFGAHGRTGTLMALLYLKVGMAMTGKEAIELVRGKHCKESVETMRQQEAINAYADKLYAPAAE